MWGAKLGELGKFGEEGNVVVVSLVNAEWGLKECGGCSQSERPRSFDEVVILKAVLMDVTSAPPGHH